LLADGRGERFQAVRQLCAFLCREPVHRQVVGHVVQCHCTIRSSTANRTSGEMPPSASGDSPVTEVLPCMPGAGVRTGPSGRSLKNQLPPLLGHPLFVTLFQFLRTLRPRQQVGYGKRFSFGTSGLRSCR
jgi:hypothetical protein